MNLRIASAVPAAFVALLLGSLLPAPAHADSTAQDPVNGATVLVPYFEVDLDDPAGSNTIISIRDASATAALGNVTIWSDTGFPVLNFPIYFTGYDVVTFDLRTILEDGTLPITASAGQDPGNSISPKGIFSQDINFASCFTILPFQPGVLFASTRAYMQGALTGQPTAQLDGRCAGHDHGDNVARGYITVDTVNRCTAENPSVPGYFGATTTTQNILSGEYVLYGNGGRLLHTARAPSIEASMANHSTPGDPTFYGRYSAYNAVDAREPLSGAWAVDTAAKGTELIVWRDPKAVTGAFDCGNGGPPALPLSSSGIVHFDNTTDDTAIATAPLQLVTQRVRLGEGDLGAASGKPGWSFINLNYNSNGLPTAAPDGAQAYVDVIQFPEVTGQGGGSAAALLLDRADAPHTTPTPP